MKIKSRHLIVFSVVAILGIALVVFLRRPNEQAVNASAISVSSSEGDSGQQLQVTINGQPLSEFAAQTMVGNELKVPLSSKPLSSINASQISDVYSQDNIWLVTFIDGSQVTVSPAMQASLPAETRSRVVYRRGN